MADSCVICHKPVIEEQVVCRVQPYQGKQMRAIRCLDCGFLRFPENVGSFAEQLCSNESEEMYKELRNGNAARPGREFHMAGMGIEILNRNGVEVSFFGAGMNIDYQWVERIYPGTRTKLVDLENMQNASNFELLENATPSDVVVASEVIEHFDQPRENFETLFRLVKENGILICGTNLYDGGDVTLYNYPFVVGHSAHWTAMALMHVATEAGFFIDFRTPAIAARRAGPHKKYILFYRDTAALLGISLFFGRNMYAPSEPV